MRTTHRLLVLPASAALALSLAACGGKADPASTSGAAAPSTSSSATASSSAPSTSSATAKAEKPDPKRYPHMNEKTKQGAQETFDYFVEGYRYALLTGDTEILSNLQGNDCNVCSKVIADARLNDSRLIYARWSNLRNSIRSESADSYVTGQQIHSVAALKSNSERVEQTVSIGARLKWKDSRWTVNNLGVEPK